MNAARCSRVLSPPCEPGRARTVGSAEDRFPCWRALSISATILESVAPAHAQFLSDRSELIFETDAGLVPIKNDGAFDYSRFHERLLWIGTSYL